MVTLCMYSPFQALHLTMKLVPAQKILENLLGTSTSRCEQPKQADLDDTDRLICHIWFP
jgi:hypothetical protein